MADFPPFAFTTQESWYGELSFKAAEDGSPLSLAGRQFEMHITPATSGAQLVPPVLVLTMEEGRGLTLKQGDPSTLVFRVPKATANAFPRQEYSADLLEVVGGDRYLFMPVRITYAEPSGLRSFLSRFLGVSVSFAARQQPIYTPLAVPGREGRPGATIITGALPPVPADGKDGDFYIEDRTASGQGRRMWGAKVGGAWPGTPWVIQVAGIRDVPGVGRAAEADVATDEDATAGTGSGLLSAAQAALQITKRLTLTQALANGLNILTADRLASLINLGDVTWWGASPSKTAAQNTAAIQACFDWCRTTGTPYYIPPGRFPVNIGLDVWTAGRSEGWLIAVNASTAGPTPVVTIRPLPTDITVIPASFFNGLVMQEGMSEDVAWAPYYGCFCYWRTSSQKMLNHPNGSNYALADSIVVGQPDGKFSPAYSWTKSVEWTAVTGAGASTGAWAEKLRERMHCEFKIEYASGASGEAECPVAVYRSNTTVRVAVVNVSGYPVRQAVRVGPTASVHVDEITAIGLQQTTTNYSVQCVTSIGAVIRGGFSLYGRRSIDVNENARSTTVIGGRWTDGIGGHLGYGVNVTGGAYVSADGPNSAPLFFSGGDLLVDETCTVRLPAELATCCAPRADAFEMRGNIILRCTFELDCFNRGGSKVRIFQFIGNIEPFNPPAEGHNFGRTTYGPDYVEISGRIRQLGSGFTGPVELVNFFDNNPKNKFASPIKGEGKIVLKPTLRYDAGLYLADGAPRTRAFLTKSENQWTQGDGYDLIIEDVKAIDVRLFCTAGRTDNEQRSNILTKNIGRLRHLVAPGAFKRLELSAETFTNAIGTTASRETSGRSALVGDEIETRKDSLVIKTTWAPGAVAAGATVTTTFPLKGIQPGDWCQARHGAAQGTGYLTTAAFAAADTVRVAITNNTGAAQTIPSGTVSIHVQKA